MSVSTTPRPLALVTGASGGIGADLARELARDGHDLVLVARSEGPMQTLAAELTRLGADATVFALDLSTPGAASELVGLLERRGLSPDVLVNNAGFGDASPFHQADPDKLSRLLQVNVAALTELTRLLVDGMLRRGRGKIMLLGSTGSFQPGPGMAVYCASKAYVLSFGEAIACELAGTGVTVTTLCPGPTRTGFASAASAERIGVFTSPLVTVMDSAAVAAVGYRGLKAGRRVVVPGHTNKLSALAGRFAPRRAVLALTRVLLKGR